MRTFNVLDDRALLEMLAQWSIPCIEGAIENYKKGDETLYGTILAIGLICDTYHKAMQTGNSVECAERAVPSTEGKEEENE